MKQLLTIQDLQEFLHQLDTQSVGLVPTMGTIHDGHLSLVEASLKENDVTICSIFLNPLQFNNKEDLDKYPKTPTQDLEHLSKKGCDAVFMPRYEELFPTTPLTGMTFGPLESVMEGKHRPGHFSGVGVIVCKFLMLVQPDKAYFGQKDLQQFAIIQKMVQDLSIPVELEMMPTIREEDGLAMSSRNLRLTPAQRKEAPFLQQQLIYASQNLRIKSLFEVKKNVISAFGRSPFDLEYFEIVDLDTLQSLNEIKFPLALCVAASIGNIRLIDNVIVKN